MKRAYFVDKHIASVIYFVDKPYCVSNILLACFVSLSCLIIVWYRTTLRKVILYYVLLYLKTITWLGRISGCRKADISTQVYRNPLILKFCFVCNYIKALIQLLLRMFMFTRGKIESSIYNLASVVTFLKSCVTNV